MCGSGVHILSRSGTGRYTCMHTHTHTHTQETRTTSNKQYALASVCVCGGRMRGEFLPPYPKPPTPPPSSIVQSIGAPCGNYSRRWHCPMVLRRRREGHKGCQEVWRKKRHCMLSRRAENNRIHSFVHISLVILSRFSLGFEPLGEQKKIARDD